MKLLIYGSRGWIGTQFCDYLRGKVTFIEGAARVNDIPAVTEEILRAKPTHILSLIGRTSGVHNGKVYRTIDYLEQKGNLNYNVRDNLFSPMVLALLCREHNIHFTYLGTGCIFSYDNIHTTEVGFCEEDVPNFTGSSYSTVKGYTDQLMHLFPALNLRIRMPITHVDNPRNFITKITNYQKICSISNSMTVLDTFFPVWLDMMRLGKTGTYNCTNPGCISHNEILEMYRELVDPEFVWENFSVEEQNQILDSKRSNNFLNTDKLTAEYPVDDIKTAVGNVLKKWRL